MKIGIEYNLGVVTFTAVYPAPTKDEPQRRKIVRYAVSADDFRYFRDYPWLVRRCCDEMAAHTDGDLSGLMLHQALEDLLSLFTPSERAWNWQTAPPQKRWPFGT